MGGMCERGAVLATGAVAIAAGWAAFALREPGDATLPTLLPGAIVDSGYTTSESCAGCHPGAYASWHASYHRTMTQAATPETVLAHFDGVRLEDRGLVVELSREGDVYFAELEDPVWREDRDPDKPAVGPRIRARVVMTTGSHHLQNYWFRRPSSGPLYRDYPDNGALVQVPFVWLIDEARWVPAQDSFLTPPSARPEPPAVWNSNCHLCHSVAPAPGLGPQGFETAVSELGIACEACHGPAGPHAAANRSPWQRYARHLSDEPDQTIVDPRRLARDRSSEVCGQCHAFAAVLDEAAWKRKGVGYQPGHPLAEKKAVLLYEDPPKSALLQAHLSREPNALDGRYWGDGTIRVAGREYNGLLESECHTQGTLTCLSCHSMHGYRDAADQLVGEPMQQVCLDCHGQYVADPQAHTRHAVGTPGSDCVDCHMPHTTYGLFVAMRSHRIDSPDAGLSHRTGRPNACNLCHLDQSLGWAARRLEDWYGTQPPSVPLPEVPAGAQWALSGDAAQRAVVAWSLGWENARAAIPDDFAVPLLAALLEDPYAAVRRVAGDALRRQPGFEGFAYDFVADPAARARRRADAMARTPLSAERAALYDSLLSRRNDRPLRIIE